MDIAPIAGDRVRRSIFFVFEKGEKLSKFFVYTHLII